MGEPLKRWDLVLTKRRLVAALKSGLTPREMANEAGCSENTVRDQMARHGLLATAGVPSRVGEDYSRLGSITAVAELHGVSFATARRWLLSAGVSLHEAHRPQDREFDLKSAAQRYASGETLAAIASEASVSVNTLKRRLEGHGVTMRPRGRRSQLG